MKMNTAPIARTQPSNRIRPVRLQRFDWTQTHFDTIRTTLLYISVHPLVTNPLLGMQIL